MLDTVTKAVYFTNEMMKQGTERGSQVAMNVASDVVLSEEPGGNFTFGQIEESPQRGVSCQRWFGSASFGG